MNGCCKTSKSGSIKYNPDAPNSTDETGTAWSQVTNAAKVCQYVNAKLSFGSGTKACGDGVCASGESSSCPEDCGSCVGKCGSYVTGATCQCDALCKTQGDCCWDHNLYCSN
ncbi:MAG TPA: hypothetical protein DCQ06_02055 [Myxococcales bacterium]|nr:hypothetical protein [Myxococcales bacterium]